jgi:phage terminase large subunit-like protein
VHEPLPDICEWAEANFYIVETGRPIQLQPHQRRILRAMTEQVQQPGGTWRFRWTTWLYSTVKKSGKTTISALVARWAAETWGPFQEVYNLGNKLKQAKERAYRKIKQSIELGPPGMKADWDIQATQMEHLPSGSMIQALPISDAGEAGGNQSVTIWTELWGFQYEEALRMWDEMQPVPTRPLSVRFVDTYAGYEGESELLRSVWNLALNDDGTMADGAIRLDDDLPIVGVPSAGLIAYIDQGTEARRMPWQQGDEGRAYYAQQAASERDHNYRRLHLNEWVSSQNALFVPAMWDRLAEARFEPKRGDVVVVGVDASVSGDSMALSVIALRGETVHEIDTRVWEPDGAKLDYAETLKPALADVLKRYPVVSVAYDPYQLHDVMTQAAKQYRRVEFFEFQQGEPRVRADTALVNRVRQGTFRHTGNEKLRQHAINADGKEIGDARALRIVKRADNKKIDAVIAASMGAYRAAELAGQGQKGGIGKPMKVKWS